MSLRLFYIGDLDWELGSWCGKIFGGIWDYVIIN